MDDKFKVGDVLKKVQYRFDLDHPIGAICKITKCDGDGLPWGRIEGYEYDEYRYDDLELSCLDQRDWEYEEIADSPLMKAMS